MNKILSRFTFCWDLANNHMGNIEHGLNIIRQIGNVCKQYPQFNYIFKFQYRDLNSLIHPDYKNRMDIKYIKRFSECAFTEEQFLILKQEIEKMGFYTACTPFDEKSVDLIEKQNFDVVKIASVSFTDFPLLEKVTKLNKPIILSTASHSFDDINRVVEFMQHRKKEFAILHCRAIYPTKIEDMELNQIDLLREKYSNIPIGLSSHEEESELSTQLCIAKKGKIMECHIDTDCMSRNIYSKYPYRVENILKAATESFKMCGIESQRYKKSDSEEKDLNQFRRGVFINKNLTKGTKLTKDDIFFAIPYQGTEQLSANDWSKYIDYTLVENINKNEPVFKNQVEVFDRQKRIREIYDKLKKFIEQNKIVIPNNCEWEISHHQGINKFEEIGTAIITLYNNEYAKKLLVMLPGQQHPEHFHIKKKESFFVLHGDLLLSVVDKDKTPEDQSTIFCNSLLLNEGDSYTLEREIPHSFTSKNGCIFEEISTEQFLNDSFYSDNRVTKNKDRKTKIIYSR